MEMIVKHGLDGLSMQKLARAAGVSPATIYIYFKDREDLILQLSIRESERMVQETMRDFDPDMDFEEGLRIQWKNRARYWMNRPVHAQFLEQIHHSPYGEKAYEQTKKEFSNTMRQFVKGAIQRREIIQLPVEVFWSVAFAPLYNLLKFHLNGKGLRGNAFELTDDLLETCLQAVLKALKP